MDMKITISGQGVDPDDKIVEFTLVAETADYKGTMSFCGYSDGFHAFANQLLAFPFESKKPVTFSDTEGYFPSKKPILHVELHDALGRIDFTVRTEDEDGNYATFSDGSIDTESLHGFAKMLLTTDFNNETSLTWKSNP